MKKFGIGEAMFAISLAGLAGLSFVYGDFTPLLGPLPGPKILTYGLGAIVLAACAGLFFARTLAASAITIAVCAVAWAAVSSPPIFHQPLSVGSWYGFSEAVTLLVGVWTLYALSRRRDHAVAATALIGDRALRVGRILFGGACLVYGFAHFAYSAYTLPFVPAWLPMRLPLVYLTGAFHIAAGVGLISGILPRLAATLEATMIILFGLLVWLPSHFAHPIPKWAGSPQNQWSETIVNFLLAAVACMIAKSLRAGKVKT
jgi:uncharacterized membrane protein